ncbi:MAG: HAD family hydrolase [Theionarchaea archaeon]|nr:HAD family hydrolase [Theionarchaea archaeon]
MKCILLDLDGTLIDTAAAIRRAVQETADEFQLPIDVDHIISETLNILEGRKSRLNFLIIASHFNFLSLRHPLRIFEIKKFYEERFSAYTQETELLPGVKESLERLKGFRLAIVTARGKEWTEASLEKHGICEYFEVVVTTDDVKKEKPDPASIMKALTLLGVDPHQCLYVGDLPSDMRAGKRAGVKTAAVLTGLSSRETLEKEEPDYIFKNLKELVLHSDSF